MKVTVKDRQSLLDVAIQVLGSAEGVFALASRNGISITDRLTDGQVLEYDLGDIIDNRTADLIAARRICPATEVAAKDEKELLKYVERVNPFGVIVEKTKEDSVLDYALKKAMQAAAKNEAPPSESGQALTSIFTNQFNEIFA